jgi:two-component system, OmpR family, sensor histidine kinase KdpD
MTSDTAPKHGRLKIILGYAAGVGKTYQMLEEGQRLAASGHDVVIGYFEPHGRRDTIAKTEGLEIVPRRVVEYRGRQFEEMDANSILARRPQICLVDEFPHTNVPGSGRPKRWEDVTALLEAGIDVITTMNIQHLESLNDQMRDITGVQVRETIPDWVLKRADEVVMVDLTPGALLNRLDRGVVYAPEKALQARQNFFKAPTLAALREMALRQTAHEVDLRQTEGEGSSIAASGRMTARRAGPEEVHERILIHVSPSPATVGVIRRGRRVADYLKAHCFAVCVLPREGSGSISRKDREAIEEHLDFARKLHIETRALEGDDEAETLVDFAHTNGVTQIYLAKPPRAVFPLLRKRPLAMKVIRLARDIQVTVIADRRGPGG